MFRLAVSAPACEKQRALKGARPAVIVEGPITAAVHSRPQLETENLSLPLENSPCERPVHAYLSALFAAPTCYCTCILHPCPSPLPTIQRTFLPPARHTAQRRRHICIRLPPGRAGISFQASTFLLRRNKGYAHSVVISRFGIRYQATACRESIHEPLSSRAPSRIGKRPSPPPRTTPHLVRRCYFWAVSLISATLALFHLPSPIKHHGPYHRDTLRIPCAEGRAIGATKQQCKLPINSAKLWISQHLPHPRNSNLDTTPLLSNRKQHQDALLCLPETS